MICLKADLCFILLADCLSKSRCLQNNQLIRMEWNQKSIEKIHCQIRIVNHILIPLERLLRDLFSVRLEPLWCRDTGRKVLPLLLRRSLRFLTRGCQGKWKNDIELRNFQIQWAMMLTHQADQSHQKNPHNTWICHIEPRNSWIEGTISEKMQRAKCFVMYSSDCIMFPIWIHSLSMHQECNPKNSY